LGLTWKEEPTLQYVNFVYDDGEDPTLFTGPVPDSDAAYLRQALNFLKPLSDDDYLNGPAVVLQTVAKHSYLLDGDVVYWCIEWEPGLIVVKMAPDAEIQWTALRSPVPNFGGREPLPEDGDPDEYEPDNDPQYNLIFTSWDAQFDEEEREWGSFVPADADVQTRFHNALARANAMAGDVETRIADDCDGWTQSCKQNLENWCGEGIRLKPAG
jgi:hypothetical protein